MFGLLRAHAAPESQQTFTHTWVHKSNAEPVSLMLAPSLLRNNALPASRFGLQNKQIRFKICLKTKPEIQILPNKTVS